MCIKCWSWLDIFRSWLIPTQPSSLGDDLSFFYLVGHNKSDFWSLLPCFLFSLSPQQVKAVTHILSRADLKPPSSFSPFIWSAVLRDFLGVFFSHFTAGNAVVLSLTEELHVILRYVRYFLNWFIFFPHQELCLAVWGTALCSKTNPVVQSANEALVVGSSCLNLMDTPWMEWRMGERNGFVVTETVTFGWGWLS